MHRVQATAQQWNDRLTNDRHLKDRLRADRLNTTTHGTAQRPVAGKGSIVSQPTPLRPGRLDGSAAVGGKAIAVQAKDAAGSAGATADSSSSTSSATITANDFLTLLVTEIQNQDPTSNTDPNAYIDQLVQVNSLEQLVSINSELSVFKTSGSSGSAQQTAVQSADGAAAGTSRHGAAARVVTALTPETGVAGSGVAGGRGAALAQAARAYASPERRHLPFHAATQQPTGPGIR